MQKIAKTAGVLDNLFTKEIFIAELHNWKTAGKSAYNEHKFALGYGIHGTLKNVTDEKLILHTKAFGGANQWAKKLTSL
jgi:uncharacterized protein YihD (DUF1040 family)